jgi:two-component system LytT family sensor kinase
MRKAIFHIIFWVIFFFGWQRAVYFYMDNVYNTLLFTAFDVGQIMLVFYCIYAFITPRFFFKRNKALFFIALGVVFVIASLAMIWLMRIFLHYNVVPIGFRFSWDYNDLVNNRYFLALLGIMAGFIARLSIDWLHTKRKIEESEKMRVSSELNYLKMQINPHFLFNAINTIYIQIDESKEAAKHTLGSFSEMLRYQLYECNAETVPIEKEIEYLQHYIELQKTRMDERYRINFDFDIDLKGFRVAPFLLLPLVENMFKHISNNNDNVIEGSVQYKGTKLFFYGINSRDQSLKRKSSSGIGIKNLKRRLELMYTGKYSLKINDLGSKYEVWLQIDLL